MVRSSLRSNVSVTPYAYRREAGADLASSLLAYADQRDVIVLGLPRGGVPVAAEVARRLGAPLDVFIVRKLGVPGHRELAMGAIASGGVRILNPDVMSLVRIPEDAIQAVAAEETAELLRRERLYRGNRAPLSLTDQVVILVDDGLATGSSMQAAVLAVRRLEPRRVVVAVPVGSIEACQRLERMADEVVCPRIPQHFSAVGQWYRDFSETTDAEVQTLLGAPTSAATNAGTR
jgi:putative phosphoribosyl transferase